MDDFGHVYVAGRADLVGAGSDVVVLKYDSDGSLEWSAFYDGPASERDFAHALALDGEGDVYVAGASNNSWDDSDLTTIKYAPSSDSSSSQGKLSLLAHLPRDGSVAFQVVGVEESAGVELKLFDLSGREVRTILDGPAPATGVIDWDGCDADGHPVSSGIYFARLESGGRLARCKSIVLR